MADSSVQKLCESMQKVLAQFMETQLKSSNTSEGSKIILEQNPVKLSGPGDYFSWARNASLILGSHGLQKFLKEDGEKLVDGDDKQEQWEQNQQRVMVWLLGSMDASVREQVENLETAAQVWKEIEKQFSGKSNKMQVCRILHEMRYIKQEQKSVTEYAGELKKLYRDLEFFRPFKPHDPRDLLLLREWFEPLLVQIFLDGLNSEFSLRREMIFSAPEWPTLDETISSILEEETRLAHQSHTARATDSHAALSLRTMSQASVLSKFSAQKKGKACEHCDRPGHTKDNCYKLHGYPDAKICDSCKRPGHTRDNCFKLHGYPNGVQQRRFNPNNIRGNQQNRAHLTSSTGELSGSAAQALEEFKSKLTLADKAVATEGPSSSVSSFYAGAYKGTEDGETSWDWDRA